MKKLRWQLLIVFIAIVTIGVLLIGQQRTLITNNAEPVELPKTGGVYTEALIGTPARFNPLLDYYNPIDHDIDRLIFSSLIRFDHRGLPQGDLADSWGLSESGEKYSFSIRPDAVWHDGEPVTSYDVIFTIELLRDEDAPIPDDLREFWKRIDVIDINDKTLQFILPEPFAPFLDYLTFGVLPEHILGGLSVKDIIDNPFNLKPIGSGPFRFQGLDFVDGQIKAVSLQASPDYYMKKPFFDQMVFRFYPDATEALTAYQQGDVLGISAATKAILPQVLEEPNLNLYTARLPRFSMVLLNLNSPDVPFFQENVIRRALLMGINRRWIVDRILGGQAIIAHSPIFPESWAYYDGIMKVEYDPENAVSLLKKAGYTFPAEGGQSRAKEGVALTFEMVYPDGEPYTDVAERIRADWEKIGVHVIPKAVSMTSLMQDYLEPRTYQAALVELNLARSPDPDPYPFWHQAQINNGQNYSMWDDRQVSEYLERARVTIEYDERLKLYRNFQVRFGNDIPALLLYYPVYTYAVDAQVRGVSVGPMYDPSDRFNTITDWYIYSAPGVQDTGEAGATTTP
jgi:peptide/nickel transport system substrate-binding protein